MRPSRSTWGTALVCVVALLSGACATGDAPTDVPSTLDPQEVRFRQCGLLAERIGDDLQAWVDQFAAPETETEGGDEPAPAGLELDEQGPDLAALAQDYRRRRASLGCRDREFQLQLSLELERLDGEGPLVRGVAAAVRAQALATAGPAQTVTVSPTDDLQAAVLDAQPGALVELAPGTHTLDEPLVLLQPVTLVGAGPDETMVASEAAGVALAFLGTGQLQLQDLALSHTGDEAASVMVLTAGTHRLARVRISGAVADDTGRTGYGVVVGGAAEGEQHRFDEVEVVDNAAGGIAIADAATPTVVGGTVSGNGGCGVCYLGRAGGSIRATTVRENDIGILVSSSATPRVVRAEVRDNGDAGVVVEQQASGVFAELRLEANGDVGVLIRGEATPELVDVTVAAHDQAAFIFTGRSRGSVEGGHCVGVALGIVLLEESDPDVSSAGCAVRDERG